MRPQPRRRRTDAEAHVYLHGVSGDLEDTAAVQAVLQGLNMRVGLPLRFHSPHTELLAALPELHEDARASSVAPEITPPARSPRLTQMLEDIRATGGAGVLPRRQARMLREVLSGCAAVVLVGGPSWSDRRLDRSDFIARRLFLEAARHHGACVYHIGASCGRLPGGALHRFRLRRTIREMADCADTIFLRDRLSGRELERIGVDMRRVSRSIEPSLFLEAAPAETVPETRSLRRPKSGRPTLGVAIRALAPEIRSAVTRILDRVQAEIADVVLIADDLPGEDGAKSDAATSRLVQQDMITPGARMVEAPPDPAAAKTLCGHVDAMLTTRLDRAVMALDQDVPTLLLARNPRAADFMQRLEFSDDVVPLAAPDPAMVTGRISALIGDVSLRHEIRRRVDALKATHAGDHDLMYAQIVRNAQKVSHA